MKIFEIFFFVMIIGLVISAINVLGLVPYAVPLDSGEPIDVDMLMSNGTLVSGTGNSSFIVYANGTTLCRHQSNKALCRISIQMNKKQISNSQVNQGMSVNINQGNDLLNSLVMITDIIGGATFKVGQTYDVFFDENSPMHKIKGIFITALIFMGTIAFFEIISGRSLELNK
jgi:hypothetical protein